MPEADPLDSSPPGLDLLHAGAAAYRRGDAVEALRIFEEAARATSGGVRVSALINAAAMYDELGDHQGSVTHYREALTEIPDDAVDKRVSALIDYSQALQHLGALDDAQYALEEARELVTGDDTLVPLRVPCLLSLTAVAFHRSQWTRVIDLATECLDLAVRFAPELSGHPLMNLAGAYFETGRRDLGLDFARQALTAFEAAGDVNAIAETQQNLAVLLLRSNRLDEAEEPLAASQRYFESAGLAYRAGVGLKNTGFLAECRGDNDRAEELHRRALDCFVSSGALIDGAAVRTRLATLAYVRGDLGAGRELFDLAYVTYAEHGLGLHCAQLDFWHAAVLETLVDEMSTPPPELLALGRALAVPSALAIDAVRYSLPNGNQREQWNREVADPAVRLAFRFATLCGDGPLVADLIETQCAGTTLDITRATTRHRPELPLTPLEPPAEPPADSPAMHLGSALAHVAAAAGLPVAPPPRLALAPDGRIALADYIAAAEQRYARPVRADRALPA